MPSKVPRSSETVAALFCSIAFVVSASVTLAVVVFSPSRATPFPPAPALGLQFGPPEVGYASHWTWYNFTVLSMTGHLAWNEIRASIGEGAFRGTELNSSLTVLDSSGIVVTAFAASGRNWTGAGNDPVALHQVISLKVDHLLTEGSFAIGWTGPPSGGWGYAPLP